MSTEIGRERVRKEERSFIDSVEKMKKIRREEELRVRDASPVGSNRFDTK